MEDRKQSVSHVSSYIKDLLVKMDFIGNVPPDRKICIKNKIYLDPSVWSTSIFRWMYSEDSNTTCIYVDRIMNSICEVLNEYPNNNSIIRKTIIHKSKLFRHGIINLISTYHENADASSKLRTSLDIIDIKIPENKVETILEHVYIKDGDASDIE